MTVSLRRPMTLDTFLVWEERQAERWEFDGSEPVAMVGGTVAHASICVNLAAALTLFERRGGEWVGTLVTEPGASLPMPEIAVDLPLAELYEGVLDG